MGDKPFVFVDIETNGGNGPRGRVIEVAAIKVLNGEIIDSYQTLVNPGSSIPYWITNLTGITPNDLVHAPFFDEIADQLHQFLEGSIFVAHNVLFDYSFLKREFQVNNYTFRPQLFCTVKMSRSLFPEHRGHSLEKIIQRHNISTANRHRAYDDALAIYKYTQIAQELKGIEAFMDNLSIQLKTRTLPPNMNEQVILNLPSSIGVYIFEDDAGVPLYVGKSIDIRSRVRSHFTSATSIAKEMRMSLQSHNISFIETETELEALLLESAKVKELQPMFNRKLRRKKVQHLIVRGQDSDGYFTFFIESQELSRYSDLDKVYGVFTSKNQAKSYLEETAKTYRLCPKLLGLEKASTFCFRYQLGLCKGACGGIETPDSYNRRVEMALSKMKLENWPYPSPITIEIGPTRSIIIDQWVPVAIYDQEIEGYTRLSNNFDLDTYKIIRSFIRNSKLTFKPVGELDIFLSN